MGNLWYDESFDWLRNLPANLKCVVFVTTSPGLPYMYSTDLDVPELQRPTKASSDTTNIIKRRIKTPRNVTYATLVCKTATISGKDETI